MCKWRNYSLVKFRVTIYHSISICSSQKPIANISQKITRNLFYNIKIFKHWLNAYNIKNKWKLSNCKTSLDETLLGCRQMGNLCSCSLGLTLQQCGTWQSASDSLVWQYGGNSNLKAFRFFCIFDKLILLERRPSLERLVYTEEELSSFSGQIHSPLNSCIYHGRRRRFLQKFFGASWEIWLKELMSMTSNNWYNVTFQWRIRDFPGESIIWHNVCRKQHKNKKIALRGGVLPSLPPDPPIHSNWYN